MKKIITLVLMLMFGSATWANEIYIDQIGDTLDLDITQDGQDNTFGDSTTDASLTGNNMTLVLHRLVVTMTSMLLSTVIVTQVLGHLQVTTTQ